jgi:hypothetical protein
VEPVILSYGVEEESMIRRVLQLEHQLSLGGNTERRLQVVQEMDGDISSRRSGRALVEVKQSRLDILHEGCHAGLGVNAFRHATKASV